MAEVKLSMEEYHNVVKSLNTLIEKLYETTKKCIDYKKQRDELIGDMAEIKKKAEAWNKLKEERINDYKKYSNRLEEVWEFDFISRPIENYLGEMEIILQRMDELDGKNEFQNLLSDLERGSDENQ
jgi:uncharacterized coiled-coil DUF342 family protein